MNYQDKNWWFIFFQNKVLTITEDGKTNVPSKIPAFLKISEEIQEHHFESINGLQCVTLEVDAEEIPSEYKEYRFLDLRDSYFYLPLDLYKAAGMAFQFNFWDKNSKFCSACGTKTEQHSPIMKKCPNCGKEQYPQINTAMIVLIKKDDELLLARAHNFRGKFHGLVAGFLEVGETLEECVEREVYEETHIKVKNIQYFGSQTWPYPSGLMVGFIADYDSGEIEVQETELRSAQFYHKDSLPELPKKLSLARKMIDWWLETKGIYLK